MNAKTTIKKQPNRVRLSTNSNGFCLTNRIAIQTILLLKHCVTFQSMQ